MNATVAYHYLSTTQDGGIPLSAFEPKADGGVSGSVVRRSDKGERCTSFHEGIFLASYKNNCLLVIIFIY